MDQILHYVILSGGLLAIMPLLFVLTLAVGLERLWLLGRTVRSGRRVHAAMRSCGYKDIEGLRAIARTEGKTLQGHLVATAIASGGDSADEMDGHLEERSWRRCRG